MKHTTSSLFAIGCAIALLFTFPLGNFLRYTVGNASVYPHDLILTVWLIFALVQTDLVLQLRKIRFSGWLQFAIGWTALGMLGALVLSHSLIPLLYVVRLCVYILSAWSLSRSLPKSETSSLIIVLGLVYQIIAVFLYLLYPDMRFLWVYGWDEHYYRLIGTLFDPGFTGMLAVLTLLAIWMRPFSSKIFVWGASLFLISTCILTYSRASYLALLIAGMHLLIWDKKNRLQIFLSGAVLLVALVVLAPKPGGEGVDLLRTTSVTARLRIMTRSFQAVNFPTVVLGTGLFSRFPQELSDAQPATTAYFPDNIVMLIFIQTGLPGALAWGVVLFRYLRALWKKNPTRAIALSAVIAHAQFNNTLLQPFILLYVLFILMDDT